MIARTTKIKKIQLSGKHGKGLEAIVDEDDYERFKDKKWHLSVGRYAANGHDYLHRLVLNAPKGEVVDHLNHNTLDCRKKNLRIVSQAENCKNTKTPGYYFERWIGKWHVEYRKVNFGRYETEEEAQRAIRLARSGVSRETVKQKIKKEFANVQNHCTK